MIAVNTFWIKFIILYSALFWIKMWKMFAAFASRGRCCSVTSLLMSVYQHWTDSGLGNHCFLQEILDLGVQCLTTKGFSLLFNPSCSCFIIYLLPLLRYKGNSLDFQNWTEWCRIYILAEQHPATDNRLQLWNEQSDEMKILKKYNSSCCYDIKFQVHVVIWIIWFWFDDVSHSSEQI